MNGLPPLIVLLASSPLVVLAMLAFDNLVLIERGRYPAFWEADGGACHVLSRQEAI